MKFSKAKVLNIILFSAASLVVVSSTAFLYVRVTNTENKVQNLLEKQEQIEKSYEISLYEDHLKFSEQIGLISEADSLKQQLNTLLSLKENEEYIKISEVYTSYNSFSEKLNRNINAKLDTNDLNGKVSLWGEKLIRKDLESLKGDIEAANISLDNSYDKYLESLPKANESPISSAEGYSYTNVETERGKFGVYLIKVALSSVKVVTASANGEDCKDNCPTKSLSDHVKDNGGFAGMHGAYFCPPDYSSCSGKVNSSDYAFYKSSSGKWLNEKALSWGDTGLATFNGNTPKFYKRSSDYGGGSVTAGISNYPTLIYDGNIVVDKSKLTSHQTDIKGPRGAIGVGKSNLYLAIISNATVIDAAYVMKALGSQYALNLDGGGSSAMYINGSYVVGPGRSLPNAVVLVK